MAKQLFGVTAARSVVARHYPLYGDGPPVVYWAEGGCVQFQDERPPPIGKGRGAMTWPLAWERLAAIHESAQEFHAKAREENSGLDFEWNRFQTFIEDFVEVIKAAKEQAREILSKAPPAQILVPESQPTE